MSREKVLLKNLLKMEQRQNASSFSNLVVLNKMREISFVWTYLKSNVASGQDCFHSSLVIKKVPKDSNSTACRILHWSGLQVIIVSKKKLLNRHKLSRAHKKSWYRKLELFGNHIANQLPSVSPEPKYG